MLRKLSSFATYLKIIEIGEQVASSQIRPFFVNFVLNFLWFPYKTTGVVNISLSMLYSMTTLS